MRRFAVMIHIPLPEGGESGLPSQSEFQDIGALEEGLMSQVAKRRWGEFTGNEFGGGIATLYFEIGKPDIFLAYVKGELESRGMAEGSFAVLHEDETGCDEGVRIAISEVEKWLTDQYADWWKGRKKRRFRKAKVYDYYAIPLPDGRYGHCQYIACMLPIGDFIQVFDTVTAAPSSIESLMNASQAFPPISVCVDIVARRGKWRFLGNQRPALCVPLPPRRYSMRAALEGTGGVYDDWTIRDFDPDGELIYERVGTLTEAQRKLEFDFFAWSHEMIAQRIATGENPHAKFL